MGQNLSQSLEPYSLGHKKGKPDAFVESKYDPLFGFPKGRKKRIMVATEEEMNSVNLPHKHRDYCAHYWIKLFACRRDRAPFFWRCAHYKHMLHECQYHDIILRMKEYEREKRLDVRQKRLQNEMITT